MPGGAMDWAVRSSAVFVDAWRRLPETSMTFASFTSSPPIGPCGHGLRHGDDDPVGHQFGIGGNGDNTDLCDLRYLCILWHADRRRDHLRRPHGPVLRPPLRRSADGRPSARLPGRLRPAGAEHRRAGRGAAGQPQRDRRRGQGPGDAARGQPVTRGRRADGPGPDRPSSPQSMGMDISEYEELGELAHEGLEVLRDAPSERRAVLLGDVRVRRLPGGADAADSSRSGRRAARRWSPRATARTAARAKDGTSERATADRRSRCRGAQVLRRDGRCSTASTWPSPRARSSPCSARTARARRRWCGSCRP